jgi:hypothetical protein
VRDELDSARFLAIIILPLHPFDCFTLSSHCLHCYPTFLTCLFLACRYDRLSHSEAPYTQWITERMNATFQMALSPYVCLLLADLGLDNVHDQLWHALRLDPLHHSPLSPSPMQVQSIPLRVPCRFQLEGLWYLPFTQSITQSITQH